MTPNYHINVFWSDDDACWIADVPDLRYCSAHGATPSEAAAEAMVAIEGVVESLRAHADPVPEPLYRPDIYVTRAAA